MREAAQPRSRLSLPQLRGVADLIHDLVAGSVEVIEETHQDIARKPFAVLEPIGLIAAPVRMIEHIEHEITAGVYQSVRFGNQLAAAAATQVLDWLEKKG